MEIKLYLLNRVMSVAIILKTAQKEEMFCSVKLPTRFHKEPIYDLKEQECHDLDFVHFALVIHTTDLTDQT